MKLSKKMKGKIKSTALMLLSIITVIICMLAVDKELNNSSSIIAKLESNSKKSEATEIASNYDVSQTSLTSNSSLSSEYTLSTVSTTSSIEPKVIGGSNHFVALKSDGTVWSWGSNTYGQLGLGDNTNRSEPTQIQGMTDVIDIAAGNNNTMILKSDGTVWATGWNNYGQLGDGSITDSNIFVQVKGSNGEGYLQNIKSITITEGWENVTTSSFYALTESGKVYAWGSNEYGQLGINSTDSNTHRYPEEMQGVTDIIKIDAGAGYLAMLDSNGSIWGVGDNCVGELGVNNQTNYALPVQMLDTDGSILYDVKDISAGGHQTLLIKSDNTAWGVGYNAFGNLGIGNNTACITTITPLINADGEQMTNVKNIYSESDATYITVNGEKGMYVTGENRYGGLFTEDTTDRNAYEHVEIDKDILMVAATKFRYWSGSTQYSFQTGLIVDTNGNIYTVGYNQNGEMGNGIILNSTTPINMSTPGLNVRNEYIKIDENLEIEIEDGFNLLNNKVSKSDFTWTSSNEDVATINSSGVVTGKYIGETTITGIHNSSELKVRAIISVYRNKEGAITIPQVVVQDNVTIALKEDGTVWATGYNGYGQLGDGTTVDKTEFVQVMIDENTPLTNVLKLSTGSEFNTIALTKTGEVYGWGNNSYGNLATGDITAQLYVHKMEIKSSYKAIDVAANYQMTYVLTADGKQHYVGICEESGYNQNLGNASTYEFKEITQVSDGIKIEAQAFTVMVMQGKGTTLGWGYDSWGQLGQGSTARTRGLTHIGKDIVDIHLGEYAGIVQKEDKEIYITGLNNFNGMTGGLGIGSTSNLITTYQKIELPSDSSRKVVKVKRQGFNTVVLASDGTVWAAGYNGYGQLSQGDTTATNTFVQIKENESTYITDCLDIAAGEVLGDGRVSKNIAIIRNDGTVWMSGDNTYKQMGNSNTTSTSYMKKAGIDNVKLNVRNEYIKVGDTLDVNVEEASEFNVLIKEDAKQSDWTWSSSNEEVATIDNNGIVTAKALGHTTITGYNASNRLKARVIINVYRNKEGAITVPQVEEGTGFTVVLKEDGTVWTTGYNAWGQLGDGTTTNRNILKQVKIDENTYLTNIKKISTSYGATMALTLDGEIYVWGYNTYGQLGVGDTTNRLYAEKVKGIGGEEYLENIIDIAKSHDSGLAIDKDGNIYGWGEDNEYTLLGVGTTYTPLKMEKITNVVSINSGYSEGAAILSNGETWVWGYNTKGALGNGKEEDATTERCLSNDITEIKLNGGSGYILKEDKTIWASGLNDAGQLGLGDTTNRQIFTQVMYENGNAVTAKTIQAGSKNLQYIGTDGKAYITGYNGYGQVGDGTTTNAIYPTVMINADGTEITDVLSLITGNCISGSIPLNTGIIRQDGTVWLAGDNTYGQIGDYSNNSSSYLTKVGTNEVILNKNNEYIKVDENIDLEVLVASGFNVFIQDEINQSDWTWSSSNEEVATVDNNGIVTGKTIGYTAITGYNSKTGFKARVIINVYRDKEGAITVPQVAEGEGFTIVLKEDGTVWATGKNNLGQLGDGTTTNSNVLKQVKIDEDAYLTNVKKISASFTHIMALTKDGEVYAWGYNGNGQLGQGDGTNRSYATKVKGIKGEGYLENIIDIAMAHDDAYALNNEGEFIAWGGGSGFLGQAASTTPIKIEKVSNIISIDTGYNDVGAMFSDGETWTWGHTPYGSIGSGTTSSSAMQNVLGNDIVQIKFDGYSGYILKEDRTVWSSGFNNCGQLGLGDTTTRTTFEQVVFENGEAVTAKTIQAGSRNLQFIGTDGKIYVTGYNGKGQLSNGTTNNALYPTVMLNADGTEVVDGILLVDGGSSCHQTASLNMGIIREDGTVWLAGDNTYGQLGNGISTTITSTYLTKVGINETTLNIRNEYIKIGDILEVNIENVSGFNVFIQDEVNQGDWTWSSSNEEVATIDNNGIVTGKAIGYTAITGYNSKTGLKARAIVNVYRNKEGAITVPQVEEGEGFTVVLKEDGTVWATGYNNVGQLGDGTTTNRSRLRQVKIDENTYLTNVQKISSSFSHIMALTLSGEVYAWGYNDDGQLGQGDGATRSYATKVKGIGGEGYLENIIDIAMAHDEAYAVNDKGEFIAWGGGYAFLGQSASTTPVKIEMVSNIISIDAGYNDVGAMFANGETWTWGHNQNGSIGNGTTAGISMQNFLGNDIVQIKFDGYSGYILKENRTVWSCGLNNYGQLGLGDTTTRLTYNQVVFENGDTVTAKAIQAGSRNLQFIGTDGKVYVTGYNGKGQLSNGTTDNAIYPIVMLNADGTEVTDGILLVDGGSSCHSTYSLNMGIIREDGTVWLAGDNTYGQIGDDSNNSSSYLTKVGTNEIILNKDNEYIKVNESIDLEVLVASGFSVFVDNEPKQSDWIWKSSNEDVATVDNNGIITGKNIGYTTIIGYNQDNGLKARAIINVYRDKEEAITVPQIVEGEGFTIVLKEDGTVWATGLNNVGQLGQGDTVNRNIAVQVKIDENTYLTNVIKISSTYAQTMALTKDGEVYTWGYNNNGELGQGDTTNRSYATKVKGIKGEGYLEGIIDIAMAHDDAYAVNDKGEFIAWGCGFGFLGKAASYVPIKIDNVNNIISVDTGYEDVGAMISNGETWTWGHNPYGSLGNGTTATSAMRSILGENIVQIKFDGYSGYILKEDGTVWSSGINNYGQLGLGDKTNRTTFNQVMFENGHEVTAKAIQAGSRNLQFIGTDGKVYVTGYNGQGQFSNGTTTDALYPTVMLNADGTEVTDCILLADGGSSYYETVSLNMGIIRQDGTVWLSGNNTYGQIGNATNTSTSYLTKMGDGFLNYSEKTITLGINESKKINPLLFNIEDDMNVFTDSSTEVGELTYTIEDETTAIVTTLGMITGKAQGITKIKVEDTITGATTNIWVKVVEDENIKINLGYKFTIALKQDGSVWSWGENHVGQLGLGNTTYYNEPQKITGITEKIVDIESGYYHSIALTENGEVYTWGYNYQGQCGNGTAQNVLTPIKVTGLTNIVKINAYKYMTIALTENGEVYVWGSGYGATPVKLNFTRKIIDIAGNIVLAENRRAYNLTETMSYGKDLIKISAGENHYLGLTADGEVYAWGTNNYGQLGNGNNTSSNIPTKVLTPDGTENITDIVEISAGNCYSIISDKDGNVYTFGWDGYNCLGIGDTRNLPIKVENLNKIELVGASGGAHTAVVDWDGYVYTVGLNDAGQLGLEDYTNRAEFEMVGELQITCNPSKITMYVGESKDISLSLSSSFNLKSDNQNTSSVNKTIVNEAIASLSENTVTGLSVGKTILNATYEGAIGSVNTEIRKFYRNIEIEVLPEGGIVVPKVETGDGFTISLKADGTVWSWGQNLYGQLGLGNTTSYNEPQKVTSIEETIKDISVGNYHVLALGESGKVYTWGLGNKGQLGVGNGYNYYSPVVATDIYGIQLEDIVKVEAGKDISFAINSKGVVYVWGNGYSSRAQKLDVVENLIDVTSKYVLSGDGKVYNIATKEELALVGKIVELDEGTDHTVMLTGEQKAYAIGDNTYGQLANGNNVPSEELPVAVRIDSENLFTGIKEIKAGDRVTTIVTTDGKVWTAGMNDNNELGIENTEILDRNLPEENANISNVIFANPGYNHVVVVKADGTVYAWGNGKQGELGNRTNKNSIIPVMVGDYMIRTNTNRVILGVNSEKIVEGYVDYFNIFNNNAININYTSKDSSVVELIEAQSEEVTTGKIGIKLSGKKVGTTIVTANQENSTNIGVIQVEVIPEGKTISPNVITNGSHTISLRVDGKVFTWGDNTYGQLGNGTTVSSDEPEEVTFPEGTVITEIASGENHNVALDDQGNVWTWGRNNNYQIGHSGGNQYTPYKITGLPKVIRIAAGNNNTMVITENNELYAWGLNAYGDLGLGTYTNKVLPTKVTGIGDIIDISGGKSHFIALNRAGEVYVTGSNLYGQLGIGTNETSKINEFRKLEISEKIGTINSGDLSNIATTVDGYVYAWGGNTYGQLGTSDKENKYVPTRINNVQNIRQADSGKTHTVLRDGNNNVFVVGTNTNGQLGIGTKDNKETFEQNQRISNVIRVSAGNTYTTFLKEDGFVWACGDYNHGDKSKKSRTKAQVPVLVGSDSSSLDTMEVVLMKSEVQNIMANAKFKFNLIYIEENDTSDFSYSSYNEEIAKIDEDGDILGIREGTTWAKVTDEKTGKVHIAIVRVIDNNEEYETHVAPNVIAGENFAIGLKEDGTVWTWGYDASGLADTNTPINTNVLSTYKMIDAGKNHAIAIRTDGTVWSVGNNSNGELGIGNLEDKSRLVQIEGLTDITQIAAGETHSLAIDSYGIVYGWGSNANGELSSEYIGQDTKSPIVITIPNERIMQIAAGKNQSAFVTANGTVYGMGSMLNGYIPNISDAVKVDIGENYILILREDGSIYKYQYGVLTKVSNVSNAVDISVQNKVNAYQSVDEKAYTWGVNTNGQLGINSTTSVSTPVQVSENGTNVFRVGSGYNNTYTILNTGFVYAAGNNTYGELGNGTSENEESTTKDNSLVHTLVGDRNFEIEPTSNTLEINEIEEVGIKSNTFNVFSNKAKDLSEYDWTAEDETILAVLGDGEIQGINVGTTKLIVTDNVTGETKEGTRVVVPVDTDRIESITASGKEAEVTDAYQYEVRIPVDEDETTSIVTIKTKLETDQISVDGGTTWETGTISTTVDITNDSTTLPFIVKTEAGNELNYTLTIIRQSNNNKLASITVNEKEATKISDKVYEMIVPNSEVNVVKVTAENDRASVSIKGLQKELKEQDYNLVMTKSVEELPIKITSESGREENYTLKVYTEDYVTTLNKVFVNGEEATKIDDTNYEITITDEIDLSTVKAITNLSTSNVGINGGEKQVNTITESVKTADDVSIVTIQVESADGTISEEYTLTINKQRVNSKIQELQVNGQTIKEVNNVYTAYVTSDTETATVKITAKDTEYYITLADYAEENYTITKDVEVNADTNTYEIQIRDGVSGEIVNYTLIIKRGDTEVGIKDIFAVNDSIVKYATQISDTEYEIIVLDTYTDTNLTINSVNPESKIAIGQEDIDAENYVIGSNTKTISLTEKETIVPIVVTTADGAKTEEYTAKIIRISDDTTLNIVAVNELLGNLDIQAEISETEEDTYEVQLQNPVTLVKVIASTTNENSNIKIADGEYDTQEANKEITIDSSLTEVIITVKSEYGTEKQYTLKIKTLSDDSKLQEIIVGGTKATYNSVLGRYEVKVDSTETTYDITAIAQDSLADVKIEASTGSVNATGTAQTIENKAAEETIVPITITAQNGIASTTYQLAIIEKSNIADIGTVKVNGKEITSDEDGNYTANVVSTTTEAEIFVQALNQYAVVTVDSETSNTNNVTVTRTITEDTTVYTIKVVSEDGTNTVEKTLTINRLSGNTNITDVKVETSDGTTYTPTLQEDGTYYVKVKRQDTADVTVTLEDTKAKVTIAGGTTNIQESTETVTLLNEITQVNVVIEAEDGTQKTSIIKIEKESNNTELLQIKGADIKKVSKITSDKYEIQVDNRLETLVIDAITEDTKAKIKLGTETEYTLNKIEDKSIDISSIDSFTIDVLAEDGETTKTYTIEITRKFSTELESIVVDDESATKDGNVYSGWANNDDTANIVITPDNSLANVSVYKDTDIVTTGTGTITLAEEMLDKTATYKIIVSNPDDDSTSSTYILNITKKSTNNNIEYVKVNGETLTENEETETYETEVITVDSEEYVLEVKAEDEYATIKFDDGEYSTTNIQEETYTILAGETKEVVVTVKSQNGEEITKTVKIYRKDNNLKVTTVKVNETDITADYDEEHKNYSISLENTLTSTDLEIILESNKSKINTTIDGSEYESFETILVEDISLPGVGKKVITFTVTSEEGSIETRTITISQFSSNIELEEVKVNGKDAEKRKDGNYEITIGDIPNIATIYAKAKESTTSIEINGSTATVGEQTVNIENILGGQFIEVPIKLTSEDGTEYEYELYITVKSGNNNLETVKVNNIDATKLDDTTYRMFVNQAAVQATVDITAASESSVVKVMVDDIEQTGNPLSFIQTLPQERTNVVFTIISESGEEKEYTLEIIKESNDNTIQSLYVNGIELVKDETTGRYKTTVNEEDGNPVVKVITNNEFGYVRIALFEEEQTQSERTVELSDSKTTTVPITIRSQTGVTNVEYLDIERIYTTTNIDTLVVDGTEITNYNEYNRTYTALIDANIEEHEIFIMASNTYATIEINEDIGVGNVTTFTTMEEDEYEKTLVFTVTSESSEVQDYKIKLVKKSSNINITELIVNDVKLLPDEEKPDIYRKNIKKLAHKAKVKVTTEYPYASVKIGDSDTVIGTSEVWVDLSLTQDVITVPVLVTATDGETIATYNIILTRLSNDTNAIVSYDGVDLSKDENGKYNVSILDTVTSGVIKVVTNDENAKADIANTLEYELGGKEYNLSIDTANAGRTIEVPIAVVSEDETIENSTLVITRISTNNKTAKVEGTFDVDGTSVTKEATIDEEGNYFIGVKELTEEVTLKITSESEYSVVTRGSETGNGELETEVTLTGKVTYVNYKVTSEAGEDKTYTVKIVRQSSDVSIGKLTVDEEEIKADENGIYNAEVEGGTTTAGIIVTLSSDAATAQIGDVTATAVLDTNVKVTGVENTYIVKVTAEDGTVKEYTLKITRQTNIAGTILTENTEEKYSSQVIVYKTSDIRKEDDEEDPREIIATTETKEDGTFIVEVEDIEKYDIVVIKKGYLSYRVTEIDVVKGEKTVLDEYSLIAGDVVETGEIEIDDLVALNDNYGEVITEANEETKAIFDLNEDGVVDKLDRNILKKNYSKKAETVTWVNPNAVNQIALMSLDAEEVSTTSVNSATNSVSTSSVASETNFIVPMTCSYSITSEYGYRVHPTTGEYKKHTGIDLAGTWHTEILAVADGEVTFAGVQSGFGNCVEIKHVVDGKIVYSFYAHLSRIDVEVGDIVKQGEVIGLEGGDPESDPNPGSSTGHHLHFEIRSASGYGNDVDPNDYIDF
ncbi:MAG: cadherin-like beta sandwich domain-containing protein [Clostridia bacterium]|nr:cadherin-like beta sandwich domain-containing protein [Clostridia bacterium]